MMVAPLGFGGRVDHSIIARTAIYSAFVIICGLAVLPFLGTWPIARSALFAMVFFPSALLFGFGVLGAIKDGIRTTWFALVPSTYGLVVAAIIATAL